MKKMKIILAIIFSFSLVACGNGANKKTKIGIVQISNHESLNIVREATIQQLKEKGYNNKNTEIIYKNANGELSSLKTILNQFKHDEVDVIIPISTPAAQAAAPYAENIPVVFAAVSDPVGARLVASLDDTSQNITGTSNEIQVDQILDLGLLGKPDIKKLGLLYNSGEINSLSAIKKAKAYAKKHNLEIIESSVTSSSEIQSATQYLVDNADAIFIPNDNSIINGMDIVTPITRKAKIPTFCGVDSFIKAGGLLNVGIDYEFLGKETGNMVAQILSGTKVSELSVKVFKKDLNIYINKTTAKEIDFDITKISTDQPIIYFK